MNAFEPAPANERDRQSPDSTFGLAPVTAIDPVNGAPMSNRSPPAYTSRFECLVVFKQRPPSSTRSTSLPASFATRTDVPGFNTARSWFVSVSAADSEVVET
jgi:hypothetical protein